MSIVLLGYRGSGKTTIGRQLAERLNWPFVDTDETVIAAAGKTIREIFELDGESRFRDLETRAVLEACEQSNSVIALGGGAVLRNENRAILTASPHRRVYLRCAAEQLHERIVGDPGTAASRPSLTHLGGGIEEIRALLAVREPMYREVMTEELDVTGVMIGSAVERLLSKT